MISSMLPLKYLRKISCFIQSLSRFDYNQPRSRLSMHRIKKVKKRRLKWNLKKYWKIHGIGLKLDIIKEEGENEYLAEIENDDDSLEWNETGNPNHIISCKNSGTYFGLVKFPVNFSPSELALHRLCHGLTLQQTFPIQTESQEQTISITISASTMTEKSLLKPSEITENTERSHCHSYDKLSINTKNIVSLNSMSTNRGLQRFRTSIFKRNSPKIIFQNKRCRFQKKLCTNNNNNNSKRRRIRSCIPIVENISYNDFNTKIETTLFPNEEISIRKTLLQNSTVDISTDKIQSTLSTNVTDSIPIIDLTKVMSCETKPSGFNENIEDPEKFYTCTEPDQKLGVHLESDEDLTVLDPPNDAFPSANANLISATVPDLNISNLRILTLKKDRIKTSDNNQFTNVKRCDGDIEMCPVKTGSSIIHSSLKLITKSLGNIIVATTSFNKKKLCDYIYRGLSKVCSISYNGFDSFEPLEAGKNPDNFKTTNESSQISASSAENNKKCSEISASLNLFNCKTPGSNTSSIADCDHLTLEDSSESMQINCLTENLLDIGNTESVSDSENAAIKIGHTLNISEINELNNSESFEVNKSKMEHNRQLAADETDLIIQNQTNNYTPPEFRQTRSQPTTNPPTVSINNNHYHASCKSTLNSKSKHSNRSSNLPNYSVNMSDVVHKIFDCCSSTVDESCAGAGQVLSQGNGVARKVVGRGSRVRKMRSISKRKRKNIVQLDHKSLWTEFISDMIVNSRVRRVQIMDG